MAGKMNLQQFGGKGPNRRIDPRSRIQDVEEWVKRNVWVNVISSNVRAIRYEQAAMRMRIRFKDGSEYACASFPLGKAKGYFKASSVGVYHWKMRREGWNFVKTN